MTVTAIKTSNDLGNIKSILKAAQDRVAELENNLPSYKEVKDEYLQFKRNFKALVSDDSKFYSDDLTGKCSFVRGEDGLGCYVGSVRVIPALGQIGVYDERFGKLAGTPRYAYNFDIEDLTQTITMILEVLPEGWTIEEKVDHFLLHTDTGLEPGSKKYVEVRSPKFIK